jgi:hypothetical protein
MQIEPRLRPQETQVTRPWLPKPIYPETVLLRLHYPPEPVHQDLQLGRIQSALKDRLLDSLSVRFADVGDLTQTRPPFLSHRLLREKLPVGLVPHVQARLLARHLRGDLRDYPL